MAFLAHHAYLHCLLERCDIAAVDAELEAMAYLADRIRQPFYRGARPACGRCAMLDGRLEEAERAWPAAPWRSAGCGRAST